MRLEPAKLEITDKLEEFQFHKGTIRTPSCYFYNNVLEIFQFHKGAIRTLRRDCFGNVIDEFQFHKGAIRTARVEETNP